MSKNLTNIISYGELPKCGHRLQFSFPKKEKKQYKKGFVVKYSINND